MRAGQADRQFDLAEGRRGGIHRTCRRSCAATAPPSWSWRSTRTARRTRSTRKIEICRARLRHPDRARSAFRRRTSSSIRIFSPSRPASRSTIITASISSKPRAEIRQRFPLVHISGGVSNLSFSFRGNERVREAMHSVFLYHAIAAGMDMGIVNAGQIAVYDDIDPELREACEDVVLNRRPDAAERLLALAERYQGPGQREAREATSPGANGRSRSGCEHALVARHHRIHRCRCRRGAAEGDAAART